MKKSKIVTFSLVDGFLGLIAVSLILAFIFLPALSIFTSSNFFLREKSFLFMALGTKIGGLPIVASYLCWLGLLSPLLIIGSIIFIKDNKKYFVTTIFSLLGIVFIYLSLLFAGQMNYQNWETIGYISKLSSGSYYMIAMYFGIISASFGKAI